MFVEVETKHLTLLFKVKVTRDRDEKGSFLDYEPTCIVHVEDHLGKKLVISDRVLETLFENYQQDARKRAQEISENIKL